MGRIALTSSRTGTASLIHLSPSRQFGTKLNASLRSTLVNRSKIPRLPSRQLNWFFRRSYGYQSGPDPWASHTAARRTIFAIIGVNLVVFGAWQYAAMNKDKSLMKILQDHATLSWSNIEAGRYHTVLTAAFSHQALGHFGFNMFALWTFGSIIAWIPGIGGVHVLSMGIGSAIAGSLAWLYHQKYRDSNSRDRKWGPYAQHGIRGLNVQSGLGASGMVMGAAAVATCLMPLAPMHLMLIPIPIPLWVTTALYAAVDMYYLDKGDHIGHAAHLGGGIYGLLFYFAYLRRFGGIWLLARWGLRR